MYLWQTTSFDTSNKAYCFGRFLQSNEGHEAAVSEGHVICPNVGLLGSNLGSIGFKQTRILAPMDWNCLNWVQMDGDSPEKFESRRKL